VQQLSRSVNIANQSGYLILSISGGYLAKHPGSGARSTVGAQGGSLPPIGNIALRLTFDSLCLRSNDPILESLEVNWPGASSAFFFQRPEFPRFLHAD
jgi:hypothetical protein